MDESEIERRKIEALSDPSELSWWWLSFADPDLPKGSQFLGVAIVKGANIYQASQVAYFHSCNPGGEVLGEKLGQDDIQPPPEFVNRLLTVADIDELKNVAEATRNKTHGNEE